MPSLLEKYLQHLILSIWGFARWNFPLKWDTVCYRCVKGKGIKTMHWKTACQKLKENGGIFISSLYKDGLPRWGRQHFKWCLNCCKTHVAFQRANTNTSLPRFFRKITCTKFKNHGRKSKGDYAWSCFRTWLLKERRLHRIIAFRTFPDSQNNDEANVSKNWGTGHNPAVCLWL